MSETSSSVAEKPAEESLKDDREQIPSKKAKLDVSNNDNCKLETRLGGILCCAVCLDLPKAAVYQCSNGHLMCVGCFTHVLADSRIRDETSTCPNCRVEISWSLATRNLAVEKAVSELPAICSYCSQKYPRNSLERHETELCEERPVRCQYCVLGCGWRGPYHEIGSHEQQCQHPSNTGIQVLPYLRRQVETVENENIMINEIMSVLSFEKITFNALNYQWVIKARLNDNQRDPHLSCERYLTYQVNDGHCRQVSQPSTGSMDACQHFICLFLSFNFSFPARNC